MSLGLDDLAQLRPRLERPYGEGERGQADRHAMSHDMFHTFRRPVSKTA
ncbi:hypothetical protein [Chachezhania sediminis]|nr:hypothetical protein [Chachezhania sediminis]